MGARFQTMACDDHGMQHMINNAPTPRDLLFFVYLFLIVKDFEMMN